VKILMLSTEYPPDTGGIGTYVATLAPALADRGHEVHVLSCRPGPGRWDRLDRGAWVHRRPQVRLPLPRRVRRTGIARRVEVGLSCWREWRGSWRDVDVVEAPDWMGEGWLLSLSGRVPVVVTLHTPLSVVYEARGRAAALTGPLSVALERAAVRRADLVTAPSRLMAEAIARQGWIPAADVRIVPNPIDVDHWQRVTPVGKTRPLVLAVGRLEHRKNPEVLVQAAALLRPTVPDLEVVFVGASSGRREGRPYLEWVRDLAARLGVACHFPGPVPWDELGEWYGRSRVVAVASRFDNFPMAALEGMAAGRPVVCTDRTGTAELIAGSPAGAVVPVDGPRALADALLPFLLDPARAAAAGRCARELVRARCSQAAVAEARERCYAEAIDRWRARRRRRRRPSEVSVSEGQAFGVLAPPASPPS
jgi:glycogen(starch) synthase